MKIGKPFNTLHKKEYIFYIDNHKKYTDFNTLGLYRSICENNKINLSEKIQIRDYTNTLFGKTFNFYQLKDPDTYFQLTTLGKELTKADEAKVWDDIRTNQEKILKEKRIKHRNFGNYSKHNCGFPDCPYNGIMIKQGSWLSEGNMHFDSDKNRYCKKWKLEIAKKQDRTKSWLKSI